MNTRRFVFSFALAIAIGAFILTPGLITLTAQAQGPAEAAAACNAPFKQKWMPKGNCVTNAAVHFLGTLDPQPLVFKTNTAERMRIGANGNVGIGTASPSSKLTVAGTIQSTSGGVKFPDGSTQTTAVSSSNFVKKDGDTIKNPYGDTHAPFAVQKSTTACDPNLLGFIVNPESGADGKKLNEHYLPLAIYGYFPAKVSLENGKIRRGDPLTSSSKPGYAMKATGACKTIGYALEEASGGGTIQVFADLGENTAPQVARLEDRVQELEQQNAALAAQNTALEARLTALEHALQVQTQPPDNWNAAIFTKQ